MFCPVRCPRRLFSSLSSLSSHDYWKHMASKIDWKKSPQSVLQNDVLHDDWSWFRGGKLNLSFQCIDRHVKSGRGDKAAFLNYFSYNSTDAMALPQDDHVWTYDRLLNETSRLAGAISSLGVSVGDRVLIYAPSNAQSASAILAVLRVGAVPVVVFGGFSPQELAKRITNAGCRAALTFDLAYEPSGSIHYGPLVTEGVQLSGQTDQWLGTVVFNRSGKIDQFRHLPGQLVDWADAVNEGDCCDAVPVDSNHPASILHTSGTTAAPKGIVRESAGTAVGLVHAMESVYGMSADQTICTVSDIGWIVGQHFSVLAPLLIGATSCLLEGKPTVANGKPSPSALWDVVSHSNSNVLFTAPTAIRALRTMDPAGSHVRVSEHLRRIYLAGERSDTSTLKWLEDLTKLPVIDHFWQTESGSPMLSARLSDDGSLARPLKHGSASFPVRGFKMGVLDPKTSLPAAQGTLGALVCKLPLAPGAARTLWAGRPQFVSTYLSEHPGYYDTGDQAFIDAEGYFHVVSRADDIIQVAAHRIGTATLEESLSGDEDVAESAVIGARHPIKGQVPVAFVCCLGSKSSDLEERLKKVVVEKVGKFSKLEKIYFVKALPKTRSGKVLRRTLRAICDQEDFVVPPTIDDADVLIEIERLVHQQPLEF